MAFIWLCCSPTSQYDLADSTETAQILRQDVANVFCRCKFSFKAAKEGLNEGIKVFIGPIFSDETKELNSFFSDEDATFFSLSPDFSNVSENVIVSGENPDDQIACIRQNLIENDLKRVLLIFPRNKYGQVIQEGFRKFQNDQDNDIKFEYFELTNSMDLNNEIKILSRSQD